MDNILSLPQTMSGGFEIGNAEDGAPKSASGVSPILHPSYSCSKLKLDSLFLQFISLPQTQDRLLHLLDDIKTGRPIISPAEPPHVGGHGGLTRIATHSTAQPTSPFHPASTPPLSPRKASPGQLSSATTLASPTKPLHITAPQRPGQHVPSPSALKIAPGPIEVPQFFFPQGSGALPSVRQLLAARTLDFLAPFGDRLPLLGLKTLLRDTFGLPTSLAYPLLEKLAPGSGDGDVPAASLRAWLDAVDFAGQGHARRAYDILRSGDRQYVTPEDLHPLLTGILSSHPGLAFLHDTPEFQERYAETVVHRIFYSLNRTGSGRLTLRDMRRGDLLEALQELEGEDDVNRCTRYFSYEHFYVIYCKFWDLDADHDFLLSRDDLLRYSNHSLTYRIADRLFAGAARPLSSGVPGRMGYVDFLWFILSEEDKTSNTALDYWFRACDLNGDNYLTPDELRWFYDEQLGRMECLSQETVSFDDIWSQMQDMLAPEDPYAFSMRDLKRSRALAGTLFNVLFNLNKFLAFETRDPFTIRQEREDAASGTSPWDSFARQEYIRLAVDDAECEPGEEPMAVAWGGAEFEAAAGGL